MDEMCDALKRHLGRTDILGYAAARNTRALANELVEYVGMRDELIKELGEELVGEDGEPTGQFGISPASARFGEFAERLAPISAIEHEPKLFTVPATEVIGKLSGTEILEIDWMLED